MFSQRYTMVEVFFERYMYSSFPNRTRGFYDNYINTIITCHSRQDKPVTSMKYLSHISLSDHHNTRSWRLQGLYARL